MHFLKGHPGFQKIRFFMEAAFCRELLDD